ncbi:MULTISPECIES: aromatic ring-hydroxylating oxygenase subunit alpha [unclassified Novosphingobium]|uniref:aromatic ring-hydroxylating oxygenase subunit alpha n=1 Tax=unclassified Novosphingobium TaxID=2644732 RepID=UPI00086B48CF|nr:MULTISPECIES: SRPBCC family protein [unclassified Novosphingobium]MBN9146284.1 Rieske 2Fe-2S domain-containing protein [Novosphingobium sp.]MDR6707160.1 phenylpropionate dioxygenase-like ring-hydroxylating dioxygenase large terminal subunit [Novosphingobium sp. 1748]ODU79281.1 MAG: (2Fe-2S)-binding protein [Novosphingobium sp. SCN 63-17]OJX93077.1 MAG: (2Fe-2S)-binding protein [Novosphingobium sp. 63-713]
MSTHKVDRRQRIGDVAEIMLDYVEHKTTYQAQTTARVRTASYTDPDQWKAEIELIFRRVPLMLGFTAEMPHPGDFKAMEAMGLPVLISRDKSGQVRAFLNVCSHRGAPVAAEGRGNCARFTCKYHGWTYAQDGKLIGLSESATFGDVDRAGLALRALPCEERGGMIFVCLTPNAPMDLDRYFQGFLEDFEAVDFANWAYLGSRVIEGANWKIAFDGYLEGYHFASLHPNTIEPRTPSNRTFYEGFGPSMRIGFPQHRIAEALKDIPRDQWGDQENNGFDFVRILFPNVSAFLAPEITQVAQLFPGPTPDKNRTVLHYLRRDPIRDDADRESVEGMMNFFRDVTYQEDYVIGMEIQKGLESGAHDNLTFGRNERGNQYFHEWLNWYLQDDPTLPEPVM